MRVVAVAALCVVLLVTACAKKSDSKSAVDAIARGLKAQEAGRNEEAAKFYQEALKHDRNNKFAYFDLGLLDQLAGRKGSAEDNYRAALRIDADYGPALLNLAILLTPKDREEALSLYRHLVEVEPDNGGAHLNLGFLLKSLGKGSEGEKEIKKAIGLDPSLARRVPQTPDPNPAVG